MFFDRPSPPTTIVPLTLHLSKRPPTFRSTRFQFNNATAAAFKLNGEPDTTTRRTLNNNNNITTVTSITIIIIVILFPSRETVVSKGRTFSHEIIIILNRSRTVRTMGGYETTIPREQRMIEDYVAVMIII